MKTVSRYSRLRRRLLGTTAILVGALSVALNIATTAIAQTPNTVAYVIASTGPEPSRVDRNVTFPVDFDKFTERDSGIELGDAVKTVFGGTATLFVPDYNITIHLDPITEIRLNPASDPDLGIPFTLAVIKGTAHIYHATSENQWLLVSCEISRQSGYTLSRNAAIVVSATQQVFTILEGEAIKFDVAPPEKLKWADDGQPDSQGGAKLSAGEEAMVGAVQVTPNREKLDAARVQIAANWDRFTLAQTEQWIARAEEGDFTPVRPSTRGAVDSFSAELAVQQQAFDQPRSIVVAPTPNVVIATVTGAAANPAQSLIESGVPSSVIVGQRFRRTRIIGNPGAGGGGTIRFNPFAEQLIRLPGTRAR